MTLSEAGELHRLLHKKWTRDVGSEGYNKEDWLRFEELVSTAIRDAIGCNCGAYMDHYLKNVRCPRAS